MSANDELPPAYPGATQWDIGAIVEFEQAGNSDIDLRSCDRCSALVRPNDRDHHASWHYWQDRVLQMIRVTLWPGGR